MLTASELRRFWSRVWRRGEEDCWWWSGAKDSGGYGRFWNGRYAESAARIASKTSSEPIPDGLCIRHKCDNPLCVNPAHLLSGTMAENNWDKVNRRRLLGHLNNTWRQPNG